jgi:glycosyltransferase involved in cell wall biosynthesis
MSTPLLSVCLAAYNHESFIGAAIDSVFSQIVDFEFEVIITDDASTDRTAEIILQYKEKYPSLRLFLSTENKGVFYQSTVFYKNIRGKYLAFLEGDDRWIYAHKLQRQVDFLEQNPDYSGCFHDVEIVNHASENDSINALDYYASFRYFSQFNIYHNTVFPVDIVNRLILPTASLVLKNISLEEYYAKYNNINISQTWILQLEVIKNSKFRYFNAAWAIYNNHPNGVSKKTPAKDFKLNNIKILKLLLKDLYYGRMESAVYGSIAREYKQLLFGSGTMPDKKTFSKYAKAYLKASFLNLYYDAWFLFRARNKNPH